jgi:O-antigen/teichoic acid export membrane protein
MFTRGLLWTLLGVGFVSGTQWVILLILTNYSGLVFAGDYALALSIVTPMTLLFGMSLRAACVSSRGSIEIEDAIDFRLISLFFVVVCSLLFAFLLPSTDLGFLYLVIVVCIMKVSDQISDIYYVVPYMAGRNDLIGKATSIRAAASLFFFVIGFYFLDSVFWGLFFSGLVLCLITFFFDRNFAISLFSSPFKVCLDFFKLFSVLKVSWALGLSSFIVSLNSNLPRYFVDVFLGREAQGAFSSMSYLVILLSLPITALGVALRPKIASLVMSGDFLKVRYIVLITVGLVFIFWLMFFIASLFFSVDFVVFLYGSSMLSYAEDFIYASWVALPVLLGSLIMFLFSSLGGFKEGLFYSLLSVFVMVVGCAFLLLRGSVTIPAIFIVWGASSLIFCVPLFSLLRIDYYLGRKAF